MPAAFYTRPSRKTVFDVHTGGREQGASSPKGLQHADYNALYSRKEPNVDLFKQTFRLTARTATGTVSLSDIVEQITWQDQSADVLALVNSQVPLTGSIQLRKPSLSQYKALVPPMFDGRVKGSGSQGVSRFGALGVVIVCEVGYGRTFTPMWAMRVQPGANSAGSGAEEVDLQDGTWTLQLADDLQLVGQSLDDFKFTKGKKVRTKGWRCDQIAAAVAQQYQIPVKQLIQGTAFFELPINTTSNTSPLAIISAAYQEETNRTGKAFVIRWSAPTRKFPVGALEVVPLRRNPNLLTFRDQLINAVLTRSQQPDYATVITGRATLKQAHGKHKHITYMAHNQQAVQRFGFIHKIIDFKPVSSVLELQILTKRALAFRLTPLRSAELTHPGIATIRRGDAIRVNIPEEGYGDVALGVLGTPRAPRGTSANAKYTAAALRAAMLSDPSLFGMPDPALLSPTASDSASINQDTNVVVPVADQSIAFVTSVTHTASAGAYTMDMQTSFVDILDPVNLKAEIDANIRNAKSANRTAAKQQNPAATKAAGGGWVGIGATWYNDAPPGAGNLSASGYHFAELGTARRTDGGGTGVGWVAKLFGMPGELPMGFKIDIKGPKGVITADKQDRGYGQGGDGITSDSHYAVDLWDGSGSGGADAPDAIGFKSIGAGNIQIRKHQ